MTQFNVSLLWCMLQVSLFLVLAAPIYLAVRRRNPRAGTIAAASSLAAVILLSTLAASPWPRWSFFAAEASLASRLIEPQAATDRDDPTTGASNKGAELASPRADAEPNLSVLATLWQAVRTVGAVPSATSDVTALRGESSWNWPTILAAILAAGMACGGMHLLAGLVAVRRLVWQSEPLDDAALAAELNAMRGELRLTRPVELRESAFVPTPATVGSRRPAILLPTSWRTWSPVERRSVLAHELAHVAQHDFAAWLVARLAIVLHFYHPLVRWFARRLQLDQELAADAAAVRLLGDRQQYLHALANLALATPVHRLAGPARTFIPGRSLLVRRVEMLRTHDGWRPQSTRRRQATRWASLSLLALLAIAAAGLRPPGGTPVNAAEPAQIVREPAAKPPTAGYDFAYVPNDFIFMFALRPSEIAASPRLNSLAELFNQTARPQIPADSLEQLTFLMPAPKVNDRGMKIPGTGTEYTVFRTNRAVDFKPLLEAGYGPVKTEEHNGRELMTWGQPQASGLIAFYAPDERTLVSNPKPGLLRLIDDPNASQPPAAAAQWQADATGPFFAYIDLIAARQSLGARLLGGSALQMVQPIVDLADQVFVTADDQDPLVLHARIVCRNAEGAAAVDQTLRAAIVLTKNMVNSQRAALAGRPTGGQAPSPQSPAASLALLKIAEKVLETAEVKLAGSDVLLTAAVNDPATTISKALVPPIRAARQAAQRSQSMNNLKQLGLAAMNYVDRFDSFPPAVIYGKSPYGDLNKSGDNAADVPRSWRVELLPLLDQEELYKEYRLDQPWDSETNQAVLKKMPPLFRSPNDEPTSTNASYFGLVGPTTVFGGKAGTKVEAITDGTSLTLLFAEAKRPIPWTKPEDIPYDADQPVPKLGGWRPEEFVIALCDGSVQIVNDADNADEDVLKPWIGKADGQVTPPEARPAPNP